MYRSIKKLNKTIPAATSDFSGETEAVAAVSGDGDYCDVASEKNKGFNKN